MYMVVFFMEEILLHHYILTKLENREVIFVTKTSLVAQTVKCLPKMREIWIQSLGQKDPLEKEMATHSSTLAWRIPWMVLIPFPCVLFSPHKFYYHILMGKEGQRSVF